MSLVPSPAFRRQTQRSKQRLAQATRRLPRSADPHWTARYRANAPEFVLPVLKLRPSQMVRAQSYVVGEDLHALRALVTARKEEVLELRHALPSRHRVSPTAAAILAVLYVFRGGPSPAFGAADDSAASAGFELTNGQWAEVLGVHLRTVQRAWAELVELGLIRRYTRQVEVSSLGLRHTTGVCADGFRDAKGKVHREVTLPSIVYLAPSGRALLDAFAPRDARRGVTCVGGLVGWLVRRLEPAVRVVHVRLRGFATPTPSQQKEFNFKKKTARASNHRQPYPQAQEAVGVPAPADTHPIEDLTDEGRAAGLRWQGGGIDLFAQLVRRARTRTVWVEQRRLDYRFRCVCGLTEDLRLGRWRHPDWMRHPDECELTGSSHPTGRWVRVRLAPVFTHELFPDDWAAHPSLRPRLEELAGPVLLEATRLELRDLQKPPLPFHPSDNEGPALLRPIAPWKREPFFKKRPMRARARHTTLIGQGANGRRRLS